MSLFSVEKVFRAFPNEYFFLCFLAQIGLAVIAGWVEFNHILHKTGTDSPPGL